MKKPNYFVHFICLGVTVIVFGLCISSYYLTSLTKFGIDSDVPHHRQERKSEDRNFQEMQDPSFWESLDLLSMKIPESVKDISKTITVNSHYTNVMGVETFYREASPSSGVADSGQVVILLHGAAFKSQTWLDLGTIHLLAAMGHRVLAIDLPGYGETKSTFSGDYGQFLYKLMVTLKADVNKPFLVSPSMSGQFSVPFVLSHQEVLSGYIPVAPVSTGPFAAEGASVKVPTLIIYGEKDHGLGLRSKADLLHLPLSKAVELPGARHPAYLDQPEMFHTLLYNFINTVEQHRRSSKQ